MIAFRSSNFPISPSCLVTVPLWQPCPSPGVEQQRRRSAKESITAPSGHPSISPDLPINTQIPCHWHGHLGGSIDVALALHRAIGDGMGFVILIDGQMMRIHFSYAPDLYINWDKPKNNNTDLKIKKEYISVQCSIMFSNDLS